MIGFGHIPQGRILNHWFDIQNRPRPSPTVNPPKKPRVENTAFHALLPEDEVLPTFNRSRFPVRVGCTPLELPSISPSGYQSLGNELITSLRSIKSVAGWNYLAHGGVVNEEVEAEYHPSAADCLVRLLSIHSLLLRSACQPFIDSHASVPAQQEFRGLRDLDLDDALGSATGFHMPNLDIPDFANRLHLLNETITKTLRRVSDGNFIDTSIEQVHPHYVFFICFSP